MYKFFTGYQKNERQSFKAIRFLKWYGWKYGLDIQMSTSPQGEFRVFIPQSGKTYKLDGYAPKAKSGLDKDLAIEFHGCAYHGKFMCVLDTVEMVFFRPWMFV